AGASASGFSGDGGLATRAQLNTPSGVSVDAVGNLYIADTGNHVVRKVTTDGTINTIIGRFTVNDDGTKSGISGIGGHGGPATEATLNSPQGVLVDAAGTNIYIADTASCEVRQVVVSTGTIFNIAGTAGDCDRDGGPNVGNRLRMRQPIGIALDGNGNLIIGDQNNNRIRRLDLKTLQLTEVAGNGPSGPGTATSASVPTGGFNVGVNYGGDGASSTASTAQIASPAQVAVDAQGNVYFAEQGNGTIRVL